MIKSRQFYLIHLRISLLLSIIFLSGCPRSIPLSMPIGEELSAAQTNVFREALRKKNAEVLTLKALSHTTIVYNDDRQRMRQAFVFERPEKLRVEILPINAAYTLALLIVDENGAQFVDQQEKSIHFEKSPRRLLRSILRLPAESADLMSYLAGRVPARFLSSGMRVYKSQTSDDYVIQTVDGLFNASLDKQELLMQSFELRDEFNGKINAQAQYAYDASQAAINLPRRILMNIVRDSAQVELNFSSQVANAVVPAKIFEFKAPSDFRIVTSENQ